MKLKELIIYGKNFLQKNKIEDANIISKILAEFIMKMDRSKIVVNSENEVNEQEKTRYYLALIEIVQGMPIQYITNSQQFMKSDFYINENVLIPQPDTEILVEEVINISKTNNEKKYILDICTGSGCIGISLAKNIENSNIIMADISEKALEVTKINADKNLLNNDRIKIIQSNMFENIKGKFDIIVSNPPYINEEQIKKLDKQVQKEPKIALNGGKDGLDFYRILIEESYKHLNKDGYLCMEIGFDQKDKVIELLKQNKNYVKIYSKKDLSGNDRIIVARTKNN